MSARRFASSALAASALAAAACVADEASSATTAAPTTSTTTAAVDTSRIVPVNGDITEVVFALGLGDRVVATDLSATYPPEADALPEIGYQRALVAETILTHEPTLILADDLAGPPGVLDELRTVGVDVVVLDFPRDLTAPAEKVRLVADALGVAGRGEELATQIEDDLADARAAAAAALEAAGGERPKVAFLYLRGEAVQQLAGAGSGVDALIEAAGGTNVGTQLGVDDFEPITDEAFVEAAPEVIVVTTSGLESVGGVDGLVAIPAIAGTPAGRERRVFAYDDQLLLGLGPRTPDVLAALAADLYDQGDR